MEININIAFDQPEGKVSAITAKTPNSTEDAGAPKFDFGEEEIQDSLQFSEENVSSADTEAGGPSAELVNAIEESQKANEKSGSENRQSKSDKSNTTASNSNLMDEKIDSIDAGGPPLSL